MNDRELRAFVIRTLTDIAPDVDASTLGDDESFRDELDLDSMDFLAFVRAIHEGLHVDVAEKDYEAIDSVGGAVAFLSERVNR
jgi:acyl carrier protein